MATGWNEYDAALHCLQMPSIWTRMETCVQERGFDWDGILDVYPTLSNGEQIMVDAARTFWNTHNDTTRDDDPERRTGVLGRALWTLDEPNTRRLVEAVLIYNRIGNVENPAVLV